MKIQSEKARPRIRALTEDEIALWRHVASGVTRAKGARLPSLETPAAKPATAAAATRPLGSPAPAAKSPTAPPPPLLTSLDRRLKKRLLSGRTSIDDSLDLHGMTQIQAHRTLQRFLRRAFESDARVVLVVTGKGDGYSYDPERGVLRRNVPHWLHAADLRPMVLSFEEAGRAHGGAGAIYVRLRRRRDRSEDT